MKTTLQALLKLKNDGARYQFKVVPGTHLRLEVYAKRCFEMLIIMSLIFPLTRILSNGVLRDFERNFEGSIVYSLFKSISARFAGVPIEMVLWSRLKHRAGEIVRQRIRVPRVIKPPSTSFE